MHEQMMNPQINWVPPNQSDWSNQLMQKFLNVSPIIVDEEKEEIEKEPKEINSKDYYDIRFDL